MELFAVKAAAPWSVKYHTFVLAGLGRARRAAELVSTALL